MRFVMLLCAGCDGVALPTGTTSDADTDADADADADGDSGCDTGLQTAIGGTFTVGAGVFVEGAFGFSGHDVVTDTWCDAWGPWSYVGPGVACPGCAWSFELVIGPGAPIGDCACWEYTGAEWDGFQATWAWADSFDRYGDGSAVLEDAVLYYYAGAGRFYPLFFNFGENVHMITGDETQSVFRKPYPYYSYD